MKAVILIGGKALRLRPLTLRRPKAIVPILSQPFLSTQFALLRRAGITDIILCLASLPRRVEAAYGDGAAFGVSLRYAIEPEPLGTAGALRRLRAMLTEPFVCLNGDVLTDLDVRNLVETHERAQALLTLTVARVEDAAGYGAVRIAAGEEGGPPRVIGFEEKVRAGTPGRISVGIYVMAPDVLDRIPKGRAASLEYEVFPSLASDGTGEESRVAAHRHQGYFSDIGTLSRYHAAHRDALEGGIRIPGVGTPNPGGVIVDETASIHPDARLTGPAFLGPGAQVLPGARIGPYAVLGRRVRIEANAAVRDSILWADTRIGESAEISRTIFGGSSFVGPGARVQGAVFGDKSTVAGHSVIPWPC